MRIAHKAVKENAISRLNGEGKAQGSRGDETAFEGAESFGERQKRHSSTSPTIQSEMPPAHQRNSTNYSCVVGIGYISSEFDIRLACVEQRDGQRGRAAAVIAPAVPLAMIDSIYGGECKLYRTKGVQRDGKTAWGLFLVSTTRFIGFGYKQRQRLVTC